MFLSPHFFCKVFHPSVKCEKTKPTRGQPIRGGAGKASISIIRDLLLIKIVGEKLKVKFLSKWLAKH